MDRVRREWMILAAIIFIAALMRFVRLGHQSFWVDEILTIGSYASPPAPISYWRKILWDMHGPLYSLVMHFWSIAGKSEAWLRTPGAIAGVLSVFFIYRWVRMIATGTVALTAAWILALNPLHIYYSQELRFYSLLILFVTLSMIAFRGFLERPGRRSGIILGITLGLACLSHFMALFLCAGLLVFILVTGKVKGDHLRYGLVAALITFAMVSPWIYREIYFLRQIEVVDISALPDESKLRGELTISRWSYPYILYAFSTGFSFGPDLRSLREASSVMALLGRYGFHLIAVSLVFGLLALRGIIMSARKGVFLLFLSILTVTIGAATLAAMLNIKVFNIRYLMSAFPVFIALLAFGVPEKKVFRIAVMAAITIIMALSAWNYHFDPLYARDDMRSGAKVIVSAEQPGDLILVPGFEPVFAHYYTGTNRVVGYIPVERGAEDTSRKIAEYVESNQRIWYIQCREWDVDPGRLAISALSRRSEQTESWEFPGVRIFLFTVHPFGLKAAGEQK